MQSGLVSFAVTIIFFKRERCIFHQWMVLSRGFFDWLWGKSVNELLSLAIVIPAIIRAKICNQRLTYEDLVNSTTSGLEEDADRAWAIEQQDLEGRPSVDQPARRSRSRSP